jgi:predicted metal-dependent HD superfamily phosphohydrolase
MTGIITKTSEFVTRLFQEKLPKGCVYHSINHTLEVVEAAREIGENSNLSEDDIEILLISAWLHDAGLVESYEDHEDKSAEIAQNFLKKNNYPQDRIDKVNSLILVTKMPQNPTNLIEEIICDADLLHIGKKGFNTHSQLLRAEWEQMLGQKFTDFEWYKKNIEFISQNKFHTQYVKNKYENRRIVNLEKLQKKLRKELMENPAQLNEGIGKTQSETEKLIGNQKQKKPKSSGTDRGIETMFRNTIRTHVEFSAMADNKANIMISVNTLLLTAIIAILARKLDANPHLIIPTAIITIVSLTTLIFATIVTRPKITSGIFTTEDIEKKKANLLFFGNFYRMDLQTFHWGMTEMMNDREYLYGSMIKDFYFLGQVLGQKYRYLRICYNIFMYGLIISVIAFTIAIILYPGGTELGPLIE